jgi:hypothetical protein
LTIAIKSNNKTLQAKLAQCEFIETLLNIFLRYEWNNMLHNQVEKIITLILEGGCEELKSSLFEGANILNFIVIAASEPETRIAGKYGRKVRKGYLGQVVKISNRIVESKDPIVLKYTQENEMWNEYCESQLAEANMINNIHLGGRDPRARYHYEEEAPIDTISLLNKFAMAKNLSKKHYEQKQQQNNQEEEEEEEEEEPILEKEAEDARQGANKNHYYDDDDEDDEEEDSSESKNVYARFSQIGRPVEVHFVEKPGQYDVEDEVIEESSPIEEDFCWNTDEKEINEEGEMSTEKGEKIQNISLKETEHETKEHNASGEFSPNVYFKRADWHSTEQVLKEFELI